MRRYLVDVDGVIAELMDGFERFFLERTGHWLRPNTSTVHSISESPAHQELHSMFDLNSYLEQFLNLPNAYQDYVEPVPNAPWAIAELIASGAEVGFVTAIHKRSPASYGSKQRWLEQWFPDVSMLTASATRKGWVRGDRAIDDRYDTCMRWEAEGTPSYLFRRSWNEAPPGTPSYDWLEIINAELG